MNKICLSVLATCMVLVFQACASESVYICTGPQSRVYHKTDGCCGLNRCSGSIEMVSLEKAKDMGRRACEICE